jgi:hypothetical protein
MPVGQTSNESANMKIRTERVAKAKQKHIFSMRWPGSRFYLALVPVTLAIRSKIGSSDVRRLTKWSMISGSLVKR